MARKVLVLDAAKPDFREIRGYVKSHFGEAVWDEVNREFKEAVAQLGENPELGTHIEALNELGLNNFRQRLVRQTRIIYEFDDVRVLIHMFIHTRRDFRSHLGKRLLVVQSSLD